MATYAALANTMEPNDSDRELLHKLANGDQAALQALYSAYGQRMYAFALHLTGEVHLAEEVLQESLIAAWQGAGRYRAEGRVIAWLLSIVRNQALAALRSRSRHPAGSLPPEMPSPEPPPAHLADRSEQARLLRSGLAALSMEQRTVLELVFYQGLSLKETADVCGCPVGTVKSRLNYAKERLRGILQRQGLDAEDCL